MLKISFKISFTLLILSLFSCNLMLGPMNDGQDGAVIKMEYKAGVIYYEFGNGDTGPTLGSPATFRITNIGSDDLKIGTITATNGTIDNDKSNTKISPGNSAEFTITGSPSTVNLTIPSNDQENPSFVFTFNFS